MIININPMSPLAEAVEGLYESNHPLVKMDEQEARELMEEACADDEDFTAMELAKAWNGFLEYNREDRGHEEGTGEVPGDHQESREPDLHSYQGRNLRLETA